jgi:hypothetical protein
LGPDKRLFFASDGHGYVAYRVALGFAIALGHPVGPRWSWPALLAEFRDFCEANRLGLAFCGIEAGARPFFEEQGFRILKVGDDAPIDLTTFSTVGRPGKEYRIALDRARRRGMTFEWVPPESRTASVLAEIEQVSAEWLAPRSYPELGFALGAPLPGVRPSLPSSGRRAPSRQRSPRECVRETSFALCSPAPPNPAHRLRSVSPAKTRVRSVPPMRQRGDTGVLASAFDPIPKHELYIFPAPVPGPLAADRIPGAMSVPQTFSHHLLAQEPIRTPRGTVRIVDSSNFPASKTIAAALVEVEPGGMRELHWHPNADESNTTSPARRA